jgi:predicted  nucleic acid-binding Zn-ribbon protein
MIHPLAALLRLHELTVEGNLDDGSGVRSAEVNRLLQALTPAVHQRYVTMLRRHGSDAVAVVHRGACSGCHVRLPARPRVLDDGIYACEHCGRILYMRDEAYELYVG